MFLQDPKTPTELAGLGKFPNASDPALGIFQVFFGGEDLGKHTFPPPIFLKPVSSENWHF